MSSTRVESELGRRGGRRMASLNAGNAIVGGKILSSSMSFRQVHESPAPKHHHFSNSLPQSLQKRDTNQQQQEEGSVFETRPGYMRRQTFSDFESFKRQASAKVPSASSLSSSSFDTPSRMTLSEGLRQRSLEISGLQDEINTLREQVDVKTNALRAAGEQVSELSTKLEETLQSLSRSVKQSHKVQVLEEKLSRAKQQEKQVCTMLEMSQQQLVHTKKMLESKTEKLIVAEKQVQTITAEISNLQAELKEREERITVLVQKLGATEQARAYGGGEFSNMLDMKEDMLQANLAQEKEKVEALKRQLKDERARSIDLAEQLKEAKERLFSAEEAHITFEKTTERELQSLRSSLAEKEEQIAGNTKAVRVATSKLEKELKSLQEELQQVRSERDQAIKKYDTVKQSADKLVQLETTCKTLTKEKQALTAEKTRLSKQVDILNGELKAGKEKTATLQTDLVRSRELVVQHAEKAKELQNMQTSSDRQLVEARNLAEKQEAMASEEKERRIAVEKQLETLQVAHNKNLRCLAEVSAERNSLQSQLDSSKSTAEQFKVQYDKVEKLMAATKAKLEQTQLEKERLYEKVNAAVNERDELSKSVHIIKAQGVELQDSKRQLQDKLEKAQLETANTRTKLEETLKHLKKVENDAEGARDLVSSRYEAEIKRLKDCLAQETSREVVSREKYMDDIARIRAELDTEVIKFKSRASSLEKTLSERTAALEDANVNASILKSSLLSAQEQVTSLEKQVTSLEKQVGEQKQRKDLDADMRTLLNQLKEEVNAHRAIQNLRLLLRSAETTDATTYLEFARVKEKSLEQQLQVLVYNVTACEAHMISCDPVATKKQQRMRQERMKKLEEQLRESEKQRDDYLQSSRTNKQRLEQLLDEAQSRLLAAQSSSHDSLIKHLPGFKW